MRQRCLQVERIVGAHETDSDVARREVDGTASARPLLDADTDLLVVGAGFTGLWAASEAGARGPSVVVVDERSVGGERRPLRSA